MGLISFQGVPSFKSLHVEIPINCSIIIREYDKIRSLFLFSCLGDHILCSCKVWW